MIVQQMDKREPSAEGRGVGTGGGGSDGKGRRKLGENSERKGTVISTAHPPKYHRFYRLHVQDHQPRFPDASTHAGLQLANCKPKSQARYFWVQSPASGEAKSSHTADSL